MRTPSTPVRRSCTPSRRENDGDDAAFEEMWIVDGGAEDHFVIERVPEVMIPADAPIHGSTVHPELLVGPVGTGKTPAPHLG